VTSKEDVQSLVKFVEEKEEAVDLLVNNVRPPQYLRILLLFGCQRTRQAGTVQLEASVTYKSPLSDLQSALSTSSQELWTDTFATNTWGPYVTTTSFLHLLGRAAEKGNGRGSVIIMTSINARHWNPHSRLPGSNQISSAEKSSSWRSVLDQPTASLKLPLSI
jgi:NAD(P)-dependent dehydrogenase (short-subunit alcohol dehydrogenase family)